MTCAEAKKISILDICRSLCAKRACVNYDKSYALFHAPYREDHHPSMMVDLRNNRWRDLATGQSGDVIDLVCLTNNTSVAGALSFLDCGASLPVKKERDTAVDDLIIKPLTHPALIAYASSRGICPDVAKRYCSEAHYISANGTPCFALAFPSKSGGYELRNKRFKGCRGKKDISVVGQGSTFLFFEGFFDFLAHVQMTTYCPANVYVVLNSTSMVDRALSYARAYLPRRVELWLDNDSAGRLAANTIISALPNAIDMSYIYSSFTDLAEQIEQIHKVNLVTD